MSEPVSMFDGAKDMVFRDSQFHNADNSTTNVYIYPDTGQEPIPRGKNRQAPSTTSIDCRVFAWPGADAGFPWNRWMTLLCFAIPLLAILGYFVTAIPNAIGEERRSTPDSQGAILHDVVPTIRPLPELQNVQLSPLLSLPPRPAVFHGRDDLVDDIVSKIVGSLALNDSASIAIRGGPGVGKTSVFDAVANHPDIATTFGDARHMVPCDILYTISLLLSRLSDLVSAHLAGNDPLGDIISHLQEDTTPRLFLFDNLETVCSQTEIKTECERILSSLSSLPHVSILVTIRGTTLPSRVRWTWSPLLEPFDLDAARQTFKEESLLYQDPLYVDGNLDDLLNAVDRLPLAVHLLAKVSQTGMTPTALLHLWKLEGVGFLVDPGAHTDDSGESVREQRRLRSLEFSIRLSLEKPPMVSNPDALLLLRILGSLPGGIREENLRKVAPNVANVEAAEIALLGSSLARLVPGGILQMLSPIRSYMQKHLPMDTVDPIHRDALRSFYFALCDSEPRDPRGPAALALEESNALSVVMSELDKNITVDAIGAAINCSVYLYWNVPSIDLLNEAIDSIQSHSSSEFHHLLPRCRLNLARLLTRLDRYHEAIDILNVAIAESKCFGDFRNQAACLVHLSYAQRILRLHTSAIQSSMRAESISRMIEEPPGQGVSDALHARARVYDEQGHHADTMTLLSEAEGICRASKNGACVAHCQRTRGVRLSRHGEHDAAIAELGLAQEYFNTFGARFDSAITLYNMGFALYHRGESDYEAAHAAFTESYNVFKEIANVGAMSWCLFHQAQLELRRGQFEDAIRISGEAAREFEKMRTDFWFVSSLALQARSCMQIRQPDRARDLFSKAKSIIEKHESAEEFFLSNRDYMEELRIPVPEAIAHHLLEHH